MAEVDQAGDDIADWMKKAAPNLARILLRSIPGTAPVADVIADAIKEIVDGQSSSNGNRQMAGVRFQPKNAKIPALPGSSMINTC